MPIDLYTFDNRYRKNGKKLIAGVDEVGRGPLAGPVVVAAVILRTDFYVEEINDSKKISTAMRQKLDVVIRRFALDYALVTIPVEDIERYNIRQATLMGMKKALSMLTYKPAISLIDGEAIPGLPLNQEKVIKGDSRSLSIASASIIAKVFRDSLMEYYDTVYPVYRFSQHKGYGTDLHRQKIIDHGPSPIHRQSFLKNLSRWK